MASGPAGQLAECRVKATAVIIIIITEFIIILMLPSVPLKFQHLWSYNLMALYKSVFNYYYYVGKYYQTVNMEYVLLYCMVYTLIFELLFSLLYDILCVLCFLLCMYLL